MDVEAYLARIGYGGERGVATPVLRGAHVAHLMAAPFENLSIHRGEPIVLDEAALFDKVVRRQRGGFCYELNGLFGALLRAMGFEVAMLSAEVMGGDGEWGPPFDHMALLVAVDGERWLADVGFGDCFREPLRLDTSEVQLDGARAYRLDADGARYLLWQRDWDGTWQAQYRFELTSYALEDFAEMCHYHQTSPQSHFTQRQVCSRLTPEGRVTLSERRLIRTGPDGKREEQVLAHEGEVRRVLEEVFGMGDGGLETGD